jgi:hypothetical protein
MEFSEPSNQDERNEHHACIFFCCYIHAALVDLDQGTQLRCALCKWVLILPLNVEFNWSSFPLYGDIYMACTFLSAMHW